MPHYNSQRHVQVCGGVLDAANRDIIGYVPRNPDNEKIANPLIENELDRYPRIGATQHDSERMLPVYQLSPAHRRLMRTYKFADGIPFIALGQPFQSLISVNYIRLHPVNPSA
jgi:hypothetical protein